MDTQKDAGTYGSRAVHLLGRALKLMRYRPVFSGLERRVVLGIGRREGRWPMSEFRIG